ncbi:MAG TPA: aminotransferase class III-fold pyridoxal phosphate-dependent enzyme [Rhodanobacteraceae bacterium]|jgi:acetylornithine/succinyldiaminopimelate/putrescine aminotransferase|nr:aminotransferase class III-fold pyridoxal phosphate-dependent enzyme [Rhodanobacteraceae bacterium]
MQSIEMLRELRTQGGAVRTHGLDDTTIERFATQDADLAGAIADAHANFVQLKSQHPEVLGLDEDAQLHAVQSGFVNFYPDDAVCPFIPLAARGAWIVTLKGAVLYDCGGYGMLGFGHNPPAVMQALAKPQVMANVMTPSLAQHAFSEALRREIGHHRGEHPYQKFMCLNSGSESVTLAARIADVNAKLMTDPGAKYAGRSIKRLVVKGAFHGRTERPALYSDSSRKAYQANLASFRDEHSVVVIPPYDVAALRAAFDEAEKNGWFFEAMFLEPVMGEGDPGRAVTPEFYAAACELTAKHDSLLLVDSIQAGLRAQGVLSIVDYPGFEKLPAPDMETYSKALNGGQYPLSVLAVNTRAAGLYKKGIYGNTMTGNPRALDIACAVLADITPELRANIRQRGVQMLQKLNALKDELGGLITKVQGTGLLFSCELAPQYKCFGAGSTEEFMRERGINVIHGGANSLRFTPHFSINEAECDLLVAHIREALLKGPRQQVEEAKRAAA